MDLNKKFLKHYMETNPEGTAQTYIFLVDNQDIALNIVMSGYQAICLVQEDDGYYFSADSFIEEMRSIQFTGSCQCAYHYVASCSVKWVNDKLLTFFKDAGLDGKAGWQLFKEKEYLGKLDNQKEVEKLLEQYILRFERDPREEPELSRFHLFDAKGNVKGVRDMEIVDYLVENVQFFVVGITPYYYEHGVFMEDHDGVRMKYRIQKLIYRDQVQSGVIKRIYNLLITQPKVHREAYELNEQPVRWINFKNGYYDPVTGEMLEHNPDYLTINQIPFPYYPEDCEQVLQGGENIKKYLASSLPNKEEQQTFWEYFGYCMTQDTQFQKFLTLKGNGGTGKSVAVSLIQHVVGITNMSSISLSIHILKREVKNLSTKLDKYDAGEISVTALLGFEENNIVTTIDILSQLYLNKDKYDMTKTFNQNLPIVLDLHSDTIGRTQGDKKKFIQLLVDKDKDNELSEYIWNGINFFNEIYENEMNLSK